MKIFIDVGYTNFKVTKEDDNIDIINVKKLEQFFNDFDFDNNQLFVLNNNVNYELMFKKNSNRNLFVFDATKYPDQFYLPNNFAKTEIGNDIWFMIYYLNTLSSTDAILVSSGSCLVSVVKKNSMVHSVTINLGIDKSYSCLNEQFNFSCEPKFFCGPATNTPESIKLGTYNLVNGLVLVNKENFHLSNPQIIFCGNGFNLEWKTNLQKKYSNFIFDNNLVLHVFRKWCLDNL